jgi:hypothetical protein
MSYVDQVLDDVRAQLAPADVVLKEARERRDLARRAAKTFHGALRTYRSGSLAHGTANCPVHHRDQGLDADCGVVLDRRVHSLLGPDGIGLGPNLMVNEVVDHIKPLVLMEYRRATFRITKRAILIEFHQPLESGEDPTVDLIVAVNRKDAEGLWIPNTEQNSWNPSHPEKHTELFTSGDPEIRATRARSIRLAKAENKRSGEPTLCSFNVETFGWMFTQSGMSVATALANLWRKGAADLRNRLTPDPAGISAPIKVANREASIRRLEFAASQLEGAQLKPNDEKWVCSRLAALWPEFIAADGTTSKARLAAAMRGGAYLGLARGGVLTTSATGSPSLKHPRSFGTR